MGELTQGISADEASRKAITAINILSKDVGIPEGLIALGKKYGKEVREADIPTMAQESKKALQIADALRAAARAAMGNVGRFQLAGGIQFISAVLSLKNFTQQGQPTLFVIQFIL